MSDNLMGWISETEKENEENFNSKFFKIQEGPNKFQMLTACAPLYQVWNGSKYEIAEKGAKNVSVKGVCYVLQEGTIKEATLPYSVVKQIKAYLDDPEWGFEEFPFEHSITLNAKGAGTKEVEYNVTLSPNKTVVSSEVLTELAEKKTPEAIVEAKKAKVSPAKEVDYPENDLGEPVF